MLDAHGEDIDADDEGDEEVQVVAGTQCVDGQTQGGVVRIIRPLLGLWRTQTNTHTHRQIYAKTTQGETNIKTQTDR